MWGGSAQTWFQNYRSMPSHLFNPSVKINRAKFLIFAQKQK